VLLGAVAGTVPGSGPIGFVGVVPNTAEEYTRTTLTIAGTGFDRFTMVSIGGIDCWWRVVDSATQITVVLPPKLRDGSYSIVVTGLDGGDTGAGVLTLTAHAWDVYVDTNAAGGGNGTLATPWNTWASVPSTSNLDIGIKRGSVFREEISHKAPGQTIGAYGATGAMPVVYGSTELTSWVAAPVSGDILGSIGTFEGTWTGTPAAPPGGWVVTNAASGGVTESATAHSGTKAVLFTNGTGGQTSWIDNDGVITLTAGVTYTLKGWHRRLAGTTNDLRFSLREHTDRGGGLRYLQTDGTWAATASVLHTITGITSGYTQFDSSGIVTITAPTTGTYRLRIQPDGSANGQILLDDLTLEGPGESTTTWYANYAIAPSHVIQFDDAGDWNVDTTTWLARTASLAEVLAEAGTWYLDTTNTRVYVRTTNSVHPDGYRIESSVRPRCIQTGGHINCTTFGIRAAFSYNYAINGQQFGSDPITGWTVKGCEVWGCYREGIKADCSADSTTSTGILISGCSTYLNGLKGQELYGQADGGIIEYGRSTWDGCNTNSFTSPTSRVSAAGDSRAGFDIISSDLSVLDSTTSVERADGAIVRYCEASDVAMRANTASGVTGTGIWADHPGADVIIEWNRSHGNKSRAINGEVSNYAIHIRRNLVWDQKSSVVSDQTGIILSRSANGSTIYHNTIVDAELGIWAQSFQNAAGDAGGFTNNSVRNNIVASCTVDYRILDGAANGNYVTGGAGGTGSGNVYDYNLIGVDRTDMATVRTSGYNGATSTPDTLAALRAAVPAVGTHHVQTADPLFVSTTPGELGFLMLEAASPARNAGVAIAGVNDGYVGAAPDLGAYEYV
jgi:hypothetical protein